MRTPLSFFHYRNNARQLLIKYTNLGNTDLTVSRICTGFCDSGGGQQHVDNMINTGLKNIGLDYVDLYIYHMWDGNTPIEELLEGLNNVEKQEKPDISAYPTALRGSSQGKRQQKNAWLTGDQIIGR